MSISFEFCGDSSNEAFYGCGYGVCGSNGTSCICDPGYEHDTLYNLYRNCYLPTAAKQAFICFFAIFNFVNVLFGSLQIYRNRDMARTLEIIATSASFFMLIWSICLGVEGYEGWPAGMLRFCFEVIFLFISPTYLAWIVLKPLYAIAKRSTRSILIQMKGVVLVFAFGHFLLHIFAHINLTNGNEIEFNNLQEAIHLMAAAFGFAMDVMIPIEINRLIAVLLHLEESSGRVNTKYVTFRKKLVVVRNSSIVICSSSVMTLIALSTLHYALQIHPYRFVLVWILNSTFPFWALMLMTFGWKAMSSVQISNSRSNPESKLISAPESKESKFISEKESKIESKIVAPASPKTSKTF